MAINPIPIGKDAFLQSYCTLSPLKIWRYGSRSEQIGLFGGWLGLVLLCIALGLAVVIWQWSGLPLYFGGVIVYITIYPPLLICLWLTLTCGWWWGAIPAYLATLTLALYAQMPLPWAALFACANPLGLAIIAVGYQAIPVRRDLRSLNALMFYVQLSFVASIFSSSGALLWCYVNRIDSTGLLPIWQGWWLGGFFQSVLIVGPVMAWLWPSIERWQAKYPQFLAEPRFETRRSVVVLLAAVSFGVLFYGYITIQLAANQLGQAAASMAMLHHAIGVMQQTMRVFYWVLALVTVFITFFGYQLFTYWDRASRQLLAELHQANLRLETLAHVDVLSGLYNRRAAEEYLHTEWNRALRLEDSAALIILDIDHFKQVNDQYGHSAGDAAIRSLAGGILDTKRDIDIAGRYGGEEFIVILPHVDQSGAWAFAERLREQVAATKVPHDHGEFQITISLGIAMSDLADPLPEKWLSRADQALYMAKNGGRNKTRLVL
ncbi:GGDEF domain-containing protein [Chitinibacter sp. S2-10]|uniref:GGDEF domain-containing protein n=1 Tax=Chitinibacter sp. S2-10 TaxID=3373597 RepID=UPI003977CE90